MEINFFILMIPFSFIFSMQVVNWRLIQRSETKSSTLLNIIRVNVIIRLLLSDLVQRPEGLISSYLTPVKVYVIIRLKWSVLVWPKVIWISSFYWSTNFCDHVRRFLLNNQTFKFKLNYFIFFAGHNFFEFYENGIGRVFKKKRNNFLGSHMY
jgi:hypothetical protein